MSENSGKDLVPSDTGPTKKIILTGIFTHKNCKIYYLGIVEPISMDDADFQSFRLSFGRSGKKVKTDLPKKPKDDPADVNGYVGPWGSKFTETSKVISGPSQVNMKI
jgi:hypothetical protein